MSNTAIVYDPFNLRHTLEGHPENFRRLQGTWQLLQDDGILTDLIRVPSSPAPHNALLRVHTPEYIERLQSIAEHGGGRLDADTYVNADSYQAARLAAGGLLNMTDMIIQGQVDNGFALIRPPGHHALEHRGMGFCLLANAAIAARWAQDQHGIERVLIVDFDVHHGNGTQDIFYHDPSVLFFSTHQFPYYPGTGDADELGSEIAYGTTVNIPFPAYVGDEGYLNSFRRVLEPVTRGFQPELIILSAGFDAHWLDPLAGMNLSIRGYMKLVDVVMALADELCGGRLVTVLEGGYHLDVLPHCVLSTLRLLSGSTAAVSDPFGTAQQHERDITKLLERLKTLHNIKETSYHTMS